MQSYATPLHSPFLDLRLTQIVFGGRKIIIAVETGLRRIFQGYHWLAVSSTPFKKKKSHLTPSTKRVEDL
jgi:hypothetical protein